MELQSCQDKCKNAENNHICIKNNRNLLHTICPKHGETAMCYKCFYCCNFALYFCFGKYICDSCFKNLYEHNHKYTECNGNCHFAPHNPNGEQLITGYCLLCEEEQEKEINFQNENSNKSNPIIKSIIKCPKCNNDILPNLNEIGNIEQNISKYRPEAIDCLRKYQATCPSCNIKFCLNCKRIPYHDEITCEEQKILDNGVFCRFCTIYPPIGGKSISIEKRVCWHEECKESFLESCSHICDCGHACCGIKDEKNHFGCSICNKKIKNCAICMRSCTESPSILMRCGHPVHKNCIINYYKSLDTKKRLIIPHCNYNFACNEIPYHECAKDQAEKWIKLEKKITDMIEIRMKIEDTANEKDHVKNQEDKEYYQKPEKFARDYFVFYLCEKCNEP